MGVEVHKGGHESPFGAGTVNAQRRAAAVFINLFIKIDFPDLSSLDNQGSPPVHAVVHQTDPFKYQSHRPGLPEVLGASLLIAVFTAIEAPFRIHQMENMGGILFGGGDASGIFADEDVFHPFWKFEPDFFGYFFVFDDVYRYVRIDEAQDRKIDGDFVINFDDILPSKPPGFGVYHKGHRVGGLAEAEPVKDPQALACLNVVNYDTVLDLCYV
jgi:hypothetical protein